MPVPRELNEQGSYMTTHVLMGLVLQQVHFTPVVMENDRRRLVATDSAVGEQAIPELGIFAAPRGAGAQPFVELSHPEKGGPAHRHVGAGADFPDWCSTGPGLVQKAVIEPPGAISLAKAAHIYFEDNLSGCI
jgi:hypothetical protein